MWSDISFWFWFAFSWWLVMLSNFSCICCPSICLLWKKVYSDSLAIKKFYCLFLLELYGFFIYFWSDTWFVNIFSHSIGCLFILLMVSFYCAAFYYFIFFLLYNIVLLLPYINMHPSWVYTCSQSWTPLPPPSPYHPSGSSQCTSPKLPVSCIEPGLAIHFLYDIIHVSMPFSQIILPPSPTESKRLFYTSVSLWMCSFLVWYSSTCWFLLLLPLFLMSEKKKFTKTLLLMFSSRSFMFSSRSLCFQV